MTAFSSWLALASAASQSIGEPAGVDSARRTSIALSDLLTAHLLRQPKQRAADGHARGVGRGFVERGGHILIAAVHLDPRDDRLALLRPQPGQRRFVALERLPANRR